MDGVDDDDHGPPFIICVPATQKALFDDDVFDVCQFCKQQVRHRPNVIWPHRIICIECFVEREEPDDKVMVTKTSIEELLAKLRH